MEAGRPQDEAHLQSLRVRHGFRGDQTEDKENTQYHTPHPSTRGVQTWRLQPTAVTKGRSAMRHTMPMCGPETL